MGKFSSLLNTLNSISGINARHNKALRDLEDWIEILEIFFSTYGLYKSASSKFLLERIGDSKFDLTAIAYKARPLIKTSKNIKGQKISPLIEELIDSIEALRRVLSNPTLQHIKLGESVNGLVVSFKKLQDSVSKIEYK